MLYRTNALVLFCVCLIPAGLCQDICKSYVDSRNAPHAVPLRFNETHTGLSRRDSYVLITILEGRTLGVDSNDKPVSLEIGRDCYEGHSAVTVLSLLDNSHARQDQRLLIDNSRPLCSLLTRFPPILLIKN